MADFLNDFESSCGGQSGSLSWTWWKDLGKRQENTEIKNGKQFTPPVDNPTFKDKRFMLIVFLCVCFSPVYSQLYICLIHLNLFVASS